MVFVKYSSLFVAATAFLNAANAVEVPTDAEYTTLTALVAAAGLDGASDDYTLFAPTNTAFDNLGDIKDHVQLEYNSDILASILKDHVIPAKVVAADLPATATSLNDNEFTFTADAKVQFNGEEKASITAADLVNSDTPNNYAVHGIDAVLAVSDNIPTENTVVTAATTAGLTTLLELVTTKTNLADALNDFTAAETVFAPNNDAFTAFTTKYPGLSDDELVKVLQYHVSAGLVKASDATAEGVEVPTITPDAEKLVAKLDGENVMINGVNVVASVRAWGGIAHVLGEVLIPPSSAGESVVNIAMGAELNTLVALVKKAGLAETLATLEKLTVFAPSEEAFAALGDIAVSVQQEHNSDLLEAILKYHVAGEAYETLPAEITSLQGGKITFADNKLSTVAGQTVDVDGASPVTTGILAAQDGVVFLVETVLLPDGLPAGSIKDLAVATDDLSSLVAALTRAKLAERVGDLAEGPLTVFAPTNKAFETFLAGSALDSIDVDFLAEVLSYHVVPGAIDSTKLTKELTSLEGSKIAVDLEKSMLNEEAKIVTADVRAWNGYVHVIDTVLTKPTQASGASTANQAAAGMALAMAAALANFA